MKSISEVLTAARGLVSVGWCQRTAHKVVEGRDCYCVSGALHEVADNNTFMSAREAFLMANNLTAIVSWNDTTGRTKKEVIEAFDKAIGACDA